MSDKPTWIKSDDPDCWEKSNEEFFFQRKCDTIFSTRLNIYMVINSIEYTYKLNISIVSVYLYSVILLEIMFEHNFITSFENVSVSIVYYFY